MTLPHTLRYPVPHGAVGTDPDEGPQPQAGIDTEAERAQTKGPEAVLLSDEPLSSQEQTAGGKKQHGRRFRHPGKVIEVHGRMVGA